MTSPALKHEACVRARLRAASCTACRDACPTGAVSLGARGAVAVAAAACASCGLCAAACPTDAFDAPFELAAFLAASDGELRCGAGGLPCVAALSAEDLVVLALRVGRVRVRDERCAHENAHERAASRVEEAARSLTALSASAEIAWIARSSPQRAPAPAGSPGRPLGARGEHSAARREFLRLFAPRKPAPRPAMDAVAKPLALGRSESRAARPRRQRLLAALAQANALDGASGAHDANEERAGEVVSFASSKLVSEEACTACGACATVCPTGALTEKTNGAATRPTTRKAGSWGLVFDARSCVNCRACHDACAPGAITTAPRSAIAELVTGSPRALVTFELAACVECGAPRRRDPRGGDLCARCEALDADARDMWGIGS